MAVLLYCKKNVIKIFQKFVPAQIDHHRILEFSNKMTPISLPVVYNKESESLKQWNEFENEWK